MPSRTGPPPDDDGEKLRRFLANASLEVLPREAAAADALVHHLPARSEVYIAAVPGEDWAGIVALSARIHRAGFTPVPHLAARGVASHAELEEHLARLAESGADRLMLLGGDVADGRVGAFSSARDVLATGALARHGFTAVGFATYPELHPVLSVEVLDSELRAKLALARDGGLRPWLVSQFTYDVAAIAGHARRLRADGVDAPLHVGVSGPASWKAMARFALICGFTNSVRYLSRNVAQFGRLLTGFDPTSMLTSLARLADAEPGLDLAAPHFFSFGGAERTADFIRGLRDGGA